VVIVAALTLATSYLVIGPFGLVIAADCLAALGLIIALTALPRTGRDLSARRPQGTQVDRSWWDRWLGRPAQRPAVRTADFSTYAKISSDLGWAPVSQWHYDHGVRPLLARLMASALMEHHRVDATADPARARLLVGEEVWPFIDPSRPPSFDSKAPGVDLRTLTRIVDRLEKL